MSISDEVHTQAKVWSKKTLFFGIGIATLFTVILNVPAFLVWQHSGRTDAALAVSMQGEDEARYLARIREFTDGAPLMGNPFAIEHKNDLPPGGFAEYAIAIPMAVLHLTLAQVLAVTDVLFPFIILFLTYLWSYAGLRSHLLTLTFVTLFFVDIQFGILRESHPKITLIPFSLYLLVLFSNERTRTALFLRGLLLGLMFYTYPYHWTYLVVFELLDGLCAYLKSWKLRPSIKEGLFIFVPFVALALPWILLVRMTVDGTIVRQAYEHLGLISTLLPVAPSLQLVVLGWVLIVGGMLWTKTRADTATKKTFLLLLAALAILNSNYVTGSEGEFLGHFGRVFAPLFLFAGVLTAQGVFVRHWQKTIVCCVTLLSVLIIASEVQTAVQFAFNAEAMFAPNREIMAYLTTELPKQSVVLAPKELNQMLPILTTDYPYMSNATHFFFVPEAELTDRYLAFAALFPESLYPDDGKYLPVFGNNPGASWAKTRTWNAILKTLKLTKTPFTKTQGDFADDQVLRKRIDTELALTNWENVRSALKKYQLDYLVTNHPLPAEVSDIFEKQKTVSTWTVYHFVGAHD